MEISSRDPINFGSFVESFCSRTDIFVFQRRPPLQSRLLGLPAGFSPFCFSFLIWFVFKMFWIRWINNGINFVLFKNFNRVRTSKPPRPRCYGRISIKFALIDSSLNGEQFCFWLQDDRMKPSAGNELKLRHLLSVKRQLVTCWLTK